jgi:hypothetical protein
MDCETCGQQIATVHIEGSKKRVLPDGHEIVDRIEHHFCPGCAAEFRKSQEALLVQPGARTTKVCVVNTSPERTLLRVVQPDSALPAEEWSVLTPRLPVPFFPAGTELEMTFTDDELRWLKGERDSL